MRLTRDTDSLALRTTLSAKRQRAIAHACLYVDITAAFYNVARRLISAVEQGQGVTSSIVRRFGGQKHLSASVATCLQNTWFVLQHSCDVSQYERGVLPETPKLHDGGRRLEQYVSIPPRRCVGAHSFKEALHMTGCKTSATMSLGSAKSLGGRESSPKSLRL